MRASFDIYNHDEDVTFELGVHDSGGTHWLRFDANVGRSNSYALTIFRNTPAEVREVLLELRNTITTEIDRLARRLE